MNETCGEENEKLMKVRSTLNIGNWERSGLLVKLITDDMKETLCGDAKGGILPLPRLFSGNITTTEEIVAVSKRQVEVYQNYFVFVLIYHYFWELSIL